ncbi:hypothetical protein COT97_02575 [Candidatus Falkowbacteria bacterium CG10_big_fil_rev_8_21_14_0_10_39_11]|uniref:Uncharacterized protein n=1 Tax=Candidatus Falkowbacteria bacterium CG10_big_fil_rev_8_21_14_0_10_39_11 TaxID=1974565 RepID=A0A2H0V535_9BACT|nr:MAG: hypothetical protein COT97_02575 [Candidatus Falkowbacteria bacterium CG10_big_fil_rev_8_21_14_0_10_39_11]
MITRPEKAAQINDNTKYFVDCVYQVIVRYLAIYWHLQSREIKLDREYDYLDVLGHKGKPLKVFLNQVSLNKARLELERRFRQGCWGNVTIQIVAISSKRFKLSIMLAADEHDFYQSEKLIRKFGPSQAARPVYNARSFSNVLQGIINQHLNLHWHDDLDSIEFFEVMTY